MEDPTKRRVAEEILERIRTTKPFAAPEILENPIVPEGEVWIMPAAFLSLLPPKDFLETELAYRVRLRKLLKAGPKVLVVRGGE